MADAHNWVADRLTQALLFNNVPTRLVPYVEGLVVDLTYSARGVPS